MKKLIYLFLCIAISFNANALKIAKDGKIDPRNKLFTYSARDVYQINAHYGYSSHIIFSEKEVIKHVSMGDSLAWHIIPSGNNLFIKPIEDKADTNMTVLTNLRSYNFELKSFKAKNIKDSRLTFSVAFRYPEEELKEQLESELVVLQEKRRQYNYKNEEIIPNREIAPENWNFEYSKKGDDKLSPASIFDDGEFTYFKFAENTDIPAIFLVDENKKETLVNYHVRGKYIVIQRIGSQFILRHSGLATCIFNDAYPTKPSPSQVPQAELKTEESSNV